MHRQRNLGIAALLTIACVESPAIILGHAWAQTTPTAEVQQVKAEPERLTLSHVAGGRLELASLETPSIAVHFVAEETPAETHAHMQEVRDHCEEDAGVLHLFLASAEAEVLCRKLDDGLTRLARDDAGTAASLLHVDPKAHTVVVLSRDGSEVARAERPRSYADVSVAIRKVIRPASIKEYNLPKKSPLALQGYDPVTYFTLNQPVKGQDTITSMFRGVTYRFSSAETRSQFANDPERYLPTYGGWCATAMGESGEKVEVDPTNFKVKNGRLFLFYKSLFADAKTSWNKHEAEWEPAADKHWKSLSAEDPVLPGK